MTTRKNSVLYVGVTSNLLGRVNDHKARTYPGSFTARYNVDKLVYYEDYPSIQESIAREKEMKGWIRQKKVRLIEAMNPSWRDLSEDIQDW